jgi:type II secretory pathway component PulF
MADTPAAAVDVHGVEDRVRGLERRMRVLTWSAALSLLVVFVALFVANVTFQLFIVPRFCAMFDELLAGEPLPLLTQFMIGSRALWTVLDLILFAVMIVLLVVMGVTRRAWPFLTACAAACLFLFFQGMLSVVAVFAPLVAILDALAAG